MVKKVTTPLTDEIVEDFRAGDDILLNGVIYVARDAAHKRMIEALNQGKPLPFDIRGQAIFYMSPSPAIPGRPIGAAGPTGSPRMDSYAPRLMAEGMKGMIGKGTRSQAVKDAMKKYKAVNLATVGGVGALITKSIKAAEVIAYEDLGPEAVLRLEVEDFPVKVIDDIYGGDLYADRKYKYRVVQDKPK